MNDIEKGWLCGIIDGEGSFRLARRRRKYKLHEFESSWVPTLEIASTDEKMVPEAYRLCSGNGTAKIKRTYYVENRLKKTGYKNLHHFVLNANGLRWLLPQIVDHLVVKQEQARLIMRVLDIQRKQGHRARTIEAETELLEIHDKIRQLNNRIFPEREFTEKTLRITYKR